MAPESILFGRFTVESDAWSFGILLWEIATFGQYPHDDLDNMQVAQRVQEDNLPVLLPPVGTPALLETAIRMCQTKSAERRPAISTIKDTVCLYLPNFDVLGVSITSTIMHTEVLPAYPGSNVVKWALSLHCESN